MDIPSCLVFYLLYIHKKKNYEIERYLCWNYIIQAEAEQEKKVRGANLKEIFKKN